MTDLLQCYNKGCGQKFNASVNTDDACRYHPGDPVFHDALKGWSCCSKRSTDFTEFLNFPGCTNGKHSNEKPPEPEKPEPDPKLDSKEVIICEAPKPPQPTEELQRPPVDAPRQVLKNVVGGSLKTALEKKLKNLSVQCDDSKDVSNTEAVKIGTSCKNNSCKACYQGEESNIEICHYHPGIPIFHEGMKFWSCCQRKTSDFDNFLDQEGCEKGNHLWFKSKSEAEKIACRFDWHQTPSTVTISVFAKVADPDKTRIEVNQVTCNIHIEFEDSKVFEKYVILRDVIDPAKSNVKMLGTKVEINLKKALSCSWSSLEFPQTPVQESSSSVS